MRYLLPIALLALSCSAFAADVPTATDNATVSLTIDEYCEVNWDAGASAAFSLTVSGGGDTASDSEDFLAKANFAYKVVGTLTKPTDAPGDWAFKFVSSGTAANLTANAGTDIDDSVMVTVSNIGLDDSNGTWSAAGDMQLDVSAQ